MDQFLESELFIACFTYIDDVVIFGRTDLVVIKADKVCILNAPGWCVKDWRLEVLLFN